MKQIADITRFLGFSSERKLSKKIKIHIHKAMNDWINQIQIKHGEMTLLPFQDTKNDTQSWTDGNHGKVKHKNYNPFTAMICT